MGEKGTKAYRAVENADYQTQANAFRSLFNEKRNSKETKRSTFHGDTVFDPRFSPDR
jgi:hypothetical protein